MIFHEFNIDADVINLFFLVITAWAALHAKNLIKATLLLGAFSLLMSLQYLILGAPDVAITEAAIGAGISTILFLLAISLTSEKEELPKKISYMPLFISLCVTGLLMLASLDMPPYADPTAPSQLYLTPYFLKESFGDIGIPNVVTSILAGYRAFDTFGEAFVVFSAAIIVMMLLGKAPKETDSSDEK